MCFITPPSSFQNCGDLSLRDLSAGLKVGVVCLVWRLGCSNHYRSFFSIRDGGPHLGGTALRPWPGHSAQGCFAFVHSAIVTSVPVRMKLIARDKYDGVNVAFRSDRI